MEEHELLDKEQAIHEVLEKTEKRRGIKILLAVESGSRAWGFASRDSDFDVRFIYMRAKEWYLSPFVERKRDVIELPIVDDLDVNGWDLRKTMHLITKCNPALLEWLHSPLVYRETPGFRDWFKPLMEHYYNPRGSFWHYYKMARSNFREYLKGDLVKTKKYFYVLRPVLCMNWIVKNESLPPIEFEKLVSKTVSDETLHSAISELLIRKKAGFESDYDKPIRVISDFLESELTRLEALAKSVSFTKANNALADEYFLNYLKAA